MAYRVRGVELNDEMMDPKCVLSTI